MCGIHTYHYDLRGDAELRSPQRHGLYYSDNYGIWSGMKTRCYNKNVIAYKDYGGRGIGVSKEWINSFRTFLEDMGERPSKLHSIDRIDNEKDYSAENCRWATAKEQGNNKRIYKRNTSGFSGVSYEKLNGKYRAYHNVTGKRITVGFFDTAKEASRMRATAIINLS